MQSAALTIKAFGAYVMLIGIALLLVPNFLLAMFNFPETREIWVRVLGLLAGIVAYYYWMAGAANIRPFFVASIYGRCFFCVGCIAIVALTDAPWTLVLFGLADVAGAFWTAIALRHETTAEVQLGISETAPTR